ncbi:hypothetical protein LEP1GSC058_3321 [Leptospira fainei serovar Hurstbridge str. BUT 6]|uniref:DUF1640 domain-containing protein n=1 Tax=Leptospira fainei serovar Hurstbridge str. BUT 6 TaxID=1193011 RepID=S3UZH5_9LEPT|nr:hypothetical protein [Leptospira fainei]EPG73774.1 hypothetical protein LEP1GSC058_3321 [Leptospira fainei serovar Hurstbridge str. BUT 6]
MLDYRQIPIRLREFIGKEESQELANAINSAFTRHERNMRVKLMDMFERRLLQESGLVRKEIRTLSYAVSEIRTEMTSLKLEIASVKSEMYRLIANQTKWIVTSLFAVVALLPILERISFRIF